MIGSIETQLANVHDLAFSSDGERLAAVGGRPSESGEIELFSWPQLELLKRRDLGDDVIYQVSWQPDGEGLFVAGPDQSIMLLNAEGDVKHKLTGHSRGVTTVASLPGGYFVSGSRDQTVRVWNQPSHELVRTLNNHTRAVHDIALRPRSEKVPYVIASASADRTVRLWWPVRGRLMRFAKLPSIPLDIEWLPDGIAILAACADGHLRVIDPDSVAIINDIPVSDGWLHTVVAAPTGRLAFVGGSNHSMHSVEIP